MIQFGSHECFSDLANQVGMLNEGTRLAPKGCKRHQEHGCEETAHWAQLLGERSSAGTAGAGVSVETGWRVKVTESMADRAAPAVVQPRLVRLGLFGGGVHGWLAATKSAKLGAEAIAADMMGAAVSGKVYP